ncbi:TonB-dependent Receptor Plug Domain [Catalinimonas alkaloidigena]|uniref:TonB-dependent Receptor Plug Domain n=1 Tax=Catalinimonas alkaloidigena TaxID=1075417 RepID=A0A1G9LC68_9BACT|nr:TonB-dependent receptor [Catalinimonas alkaloidigena]SDL59484.1 TonB-dependent Receptor Plug Domain [Catalinimonas alkaloidigena]
MTRLYALTVFLLFTVATSWAQPGVTERVLTGWVKEAETGVPLFGATIYVPSLQRGTSTDEQGYFAIRLPADTLLVQVSYVGYLTVTRRIDLRQRAERLAVSLQTEQLEEVVVTASELQDKLNTTQMSVEKVTAQEARLLPALFGEVDIIKTLQLKPGVQSGGEGSSGLYVRGGGSDQNLLLFDGAPLYNANHLFGFFSVFNTDAVESVELYKGGFPAQYNGRLSSVVDVTMREGEAEQWQMTGGVGLISSRLTVEGPLLKHRNGTSYTTVLLSGRRTYFDVITRQINRLNEDNPDYNAIPDYSFYDLNGKISTHFSDADRLTLSGYHGRDNFLFNQDPFNIRFDWGNTAAILNWQHQFGSRLSAENRLIYTDYDYRVRYNFDAFKFSLGSRVSDRTFRSDFTFTPPSSHQITFGGLYTHHTFDVGRANAGRADEELFSAGNALQATELGAYVGDKIDFSPAWQLDAGLRWSAFLYQGKRYAGLEPRASLRYRISDQVALKTSYARMRQFIHLVASSGASLPTDVWYPSTRLVRPQVSDQLAAGLSLLLFDGRLLLTDEWYYKELQRQIDFRDGANLFVNNDLEKEFVFGKGWSYGNEIYLEKKQGNTTGWLGYTLSWSYRQFPEINDGAIFFPRYDRRHDISLVVTHHLSPRLSVTGTWIYGTGNAVTLPVGRLFFSDVTGTTGFPPGISIVPEYQQRNTFRMAPYHRMDVGLVWHFRPRWGESDLTFSIYNLYNRRNPYFIYFDQEWIDPDDFTGSPEDVQKFVTFRARQVSLFPVIPAITFNFRFFKDPEHKPIRRQKYKAPKSSYL